MDKGKAKILLVESQKDVRSFYNAALAKLENVEVSTAATGEELTKIMEQPDIGAIHIAIVDWEMPDVPGAIIIQRLRQDPRFDLIDIIVRAESFTEEESFLLTEIDVFKVLKKSDGAGPLIEAVTKILENQSKVSPGQNIKVIERSLTMGKLSDVEEAFKNPEFVESLKTNNRYVHCVGEYHILKREFENAVTILSEHLRTADEPNYGTIKSLSTLGKALCHTNRFQDAHGIFDRLAKRSPLNLGHQSDVGDALLGMDNLEGAKEAFGKVLKADPENKKALEGMGKVEISKGNFEAGKGFFDRMGNQFESYSLASFFNNRAIAMVRSGKPEHAIEFYEKALPLFQQYKPLIHFNLGMAYLRKGDVEKAADYFDQIIEVAAQNEDAKNLSAKKTLQEYIAKGRQKFIEERMKAKEQSQNSNST